MSLIVMEHPGKLGRAQVAMQPEIGGNDGLTVGGTSVYTIIGSGAGPAFVDLYAFGSPHYFVVTGGAGRPQYLGEGERVTYGFPKGAVITVTDEDGNGGGELPEGDLFYFKPTGSGSGDGSSMNNARTWNQANLDAALTAMAAVDGAIVLVGPLTSKSASAARGTDEFEPILGGYVIDTPVPIYGTRQPLNPDTSDTAYPCFAGDRFEWELPETPAEGEEDPIFDVRLQSVGLQAFDVQADGCHFRYLRFRRTGVCFRWNVDDLGHDTLIEDFRADNVQRFVDPYTSAGVANTINNITVLNGTIIGYSKAVIRSAADSSGMLVEDVYGDSGWQANDSFARLFNCDDTAHNITVRRCHALHIYSSLGGYRNGDGFECNDGNEDITFEDCSTNGATDGGFDTKGKRITITNGTARDCKRLVRVWMDTTIDGGTFTSPHNRGDYGNGSCFFFVNGYFTPAQVADPLAGSLASERRGKAIIRGVHLVGDGDTADPITEEGGTGRQATQVIFTGAAGAIAKFINATRTSDLNTGGVETPLTAEVADGQESIALRSFVSYYTGPEDPGDPGYVPTAITTDLTQDWPEGSLVTIELKASQDGGVTDNELCTWELDRDHPDVDADETIALSDWGYYAPEISFLAPDSGGSPVSIDVTVEDAAANPVTGTLVVTSTPRGPTDPPVYAGAGALTATGTVGATSVTPPLPRSAGENDVIAIVAHTNKTLAAPTVSGISDPPVKSILQSGNIKSHLFIKRLGVGEVAPVVTFDTAIAVEGDDDGESDTEIHAARCFLIRGCRLTGAPYEAEQGAASTLTTMEKTGPAVTPIDDNRLIMNFFVINNDVVDIKVTAGGMTKASYGYTTEGSDLSIYACWKRIFGGAGVAVPGATIEWGFKPATELDTTSQNFALAFLPEIDP